jgi:hypothetical protein
MANITRAIEQCERFIREMAENHNGYDDSGIARLIVQDLKERGAVMPARKRILSHWCHADGNPFKRGMPIAQEISMALYDRIILRED